MSLLYLTRTWDLKGGHSSESTGLPTSKAKLPVNETKCLSPCCENGHYLIGDGGEARYLLKQKPCSKCRCFGVGMARRYLNSTTAVEVEPVYGFYELILAHLYSTVLSTVCVKSRFEEKLMHIKMHIAETKHSKAVLSRVREERGLDFQNFKAKFQRESRRYFVLKSWLFH